MNIQHSLYKWERSAFDRYLNLVCDALKKEEKEISKLIKEQKAESSTNTDLEFWIEAEAEYLLVYRNLAFESFIIWLCGYLEKELNNLCDRLKKRHNLNLKLSDITGKGIKRARIYMEKVCGLVLPEEDIWKELIYLTEIRNVIVHNDGIIMSSRIEKDIKRFIDQQNPEEITYVKNSRGRIVLRKGYCLRALKTVFMYLQEIPDQS
jgi:hypothetical protein